MIHSTLLEIIAEPDVSIGLILGGRRKGKSVLGYGAIDELHKTMNLSAFAFGLPQSKNYLLPSHIEPIRDLDAIPDGSAVVVDEAYREFYSRMSMSTRNKFIDTLVALSGQKRLKCIFISQQARRIEIGIAGSPDFILFKKPSLIQMEFDRPQYRRKLVKVYKAFQELKAPEGSTLKQYQKQCTYVFSEDFIGMLENSNTPPSWWSEDLSRAYAGVPLKEQEEHIEYTDKHIAKMFVNLVRRRDGKMLTGFDESGEYIPKSKRE